MAVKGFTVFSKPWKDMPLPELAVFIRDVGFDGVELPVRPGFQVEPEGIAEGLPEAVRVFREAGVRIGSIACEPSETVIAACAEAEVDLIRVCVSVPEDETYFEAEARTQKGYEALVPALDKAGVRIGAQNHAGPCIGSSIGLYRLIEPFDPKHVCAVWDPMHCVKAGEIPRLALDILWSRLGLVNLKDTYALRESGAEAEIVRWKWWYTTGRQGMTPWDEVADLLKQRGYEGDICLTAEYSERSSIDRLISQDLAFAKSLF